MTLKDKIYKLFQAIDRQDTGEFLSNLDDDVVFRFGNMPAVTGRDNTGAAVKGFFESIKAISHKIDEIWDQDDVAFFHGTVTYTRHDASTLSVPFANLFRFRGDRVSEYLIYADISELYR